VLRCRPLHTAVATVSCSSFCYKTGRGPESNRMRWYEGVCDKLSSRPTAKTDSVHTILHGVYTEWSSLSRVEVDVDLKIQ